jgi:hypothetical protein
MGKMLDRKGFVFLDDYSRPFWICMMHDKYPMICYWVDGTKTWVTLRAPSTSEIMLANEKALSNEFAQLYHDEHNKTFPGGAPPFKSKEDKP